MVLLIHEDTWKVGLEINLELIYYEKIKVDKQRYV